MYGRVPIFPLHKCRRRIGVCIGGVHRGYASGCASEVYASTYASGYASGMRRA